MKHEMSRRNQINEYYILHLPCQGLIGSYSDALWDYFPGANNMSMLAKYQTRDIVNKN